MKRDQIREGHIRSQTQPPLMELRPLESRKGTLGQSQDGHHPIENDRKSEKQDKDNIADESTTTPFETEPTEIDIGQHQDKSGPTTTFVSRPTGNRIGTTSGRTGQPPNRDRLLESEHSKTITTTRRFRDRPESKRNKHWDRVRTTTPMVSEHRNRERKQWTVAPTTTHECFDRLKSKKGTLDRLTTHPDG
ncbi:hypothetical protein EVAR_30337_1 [Eumeta japonica]|uniref:Uncharacterized protein n=1 Tax=Eumeta variegata TaxID=151549 RepID=A0A4C1W9A7_EUMVA|nr:hypothetical protein EVAR_30337_1 [Eumeta japonica]